MKSTQLKFILQSAVIAAFPTTLSLAQANSSIPIPVAEGTTNTSFAPTKPVPPCTTPIQKIPQVANIKQLVPGLFSSLPAEQCLLLCKGIVEKNQKQRAELQWGANHNWVLGITDFKPVKCDISLRPNPNTNGGDLSCTATYVETRISYTGAQGCYAPRMLTTPRERPRIVRGRIPKNAVLLQPKINNALGHYFAEIASMETAAVTAFRFLVQELEAYQAPNALIQMAREAIQEEIGHAEMTRLLAQAYDTAVPAVIIDDFKLRSLFEIALDNAVEGCVNETFAAASGYWQQQFAEHPVFKAVIGHITDEESKHATLSWAIHEWVMPQLTSAQQLAIHHAQADAINQLEQTWLTKEDPRVRVAVGLPEAQEALSLLRELKTHLWEYDTLIS